MAYENLYFCTQLKLIWIFWGHSVLIQAISFKAKLSTSQFSQLKWKNHFSSLASTRSAKSIFINQGGHVRKNDKERQPKNLWKDPWAHLQKFNKKKAVCQTPKNLFTYFVVATINVSCCLEQIFKGETIQFPFPKINFTSNFTDPKHPRKRYYIGEQGLIMYSSFTFWAYPSGLHTVNEKTLKEPLKGLGVNLHLKKKRNSNC